MNRFGLGLGILAVMMVVGCGGGGSKTDTGDAGNMLGDGFITTTCTTVSDCSPTLCQTAKCNAATHMCQYSDKVCGGDMSCPQTTTCGTAMCNPADGTFTVTPANENMACTADSGAPGICTSGSCAEVPTCDTTVSLGYENMASCGSGNESASQGDNDPNGFYGGAAVVSKYSCAPNEAGPELSFQLFGLPAAGGDVTVSLHLADENGVVLANQTSVDLDLIVLQDQCTGNATCMNPAASGGFQGVTAGTSAERVTFHADVTKQYFIVVDGKDMNQHSYFVIDIESCGQCKAATPSQNVSCNMSVPVSSSTATASGGTKILTNYMCGGATKTAVTLAGDEIPFLFTDNAGVPRSITATLSGATAGSGATLLALNESSAGDCDPTDCLASSTTSVTFTTSPTDSFDYLPLFQRFWFLVDTAGTTDASFGLAIACQPYCAPDPANYLTCGTSFDTNSASSTTTTSSNQSTQYGAGGVACGGLTALTGPETAITFTPTITGTKTYQVELGSSTAGKDLSFVILDAGTGTSPTCSPTGTCALNFAAAHPAGSTGTLTTNTSLTQTADATFTATTGHTYYIIVDGKDAAGADFTVGIAGTQTLAGCGK